MSMTLPERLSAWFPVSDARGGKAVSGYRRIFCLLPRPDAQKFTASTLIKAK